MAQAPPSISLLYGPTGSQAISSRFAVEGQPFSAIPLMVPGGMVSNRPAHTLGLTGSAYRYGGTGVTGIKNLMPIDGQTVVSLPPFSNTLSTVSFDLGKVAGTNSPFHLPMQTFNTRYLYASTATMMCDGEVIGSAAPGASELFTTAGTVTVTNGSTTVTGSGTSWTTNTLTFSYPYTPAQNLISPGDVLQITHPTSGTVYYRIVSVGGNTSLTIFPAVAETTQSGVAYSILRTGYPSYSRVIALGNNPTYYYAGLNFAPAQSTGGSIMCYDPTLSPTHQMGPTGVSATDIAYYKSYLLYGRGSTIGWTVPGFPTVVPFASADFPASSVTVLSTDPANVFVSFEYLADQVIAIFTRGKFVVQQNPGQTQPNAFSFYRLPNVTGAIPNLCNGVTVTGPTPQIGSFTYFRPTCSSDGAIYNLASGGLMEMTGTSPGAEVNVSDDIGDILPHGGSLHWDPCSDSVIVEQYGDPMYVYQRPTKGWYSATWQNCFGPFDNRSSRRDIARMLRWTRYNGTAIVGTEVDQTTSNFDRPYANPTDSWTWASPVVNVSDIYPDFILDGVRVDCEAPTLSTANVSVTIYGGRSPYSMNVLVGPVTYNAAVGTTNSRDLIGGKLDQPFIAVTLSGATRVKLVGVWFYPANTKARK